MLIEVKAIRKTYVMGETVVPALCGVTLSIDSGEFVAIMGPSGSGKSTLMHLLGLLDVPESGSFMLAGQEISELSEDALAELRGSTIGFVFQQFNLVSRTSALENVALPLLYTASRGRQELPKKILEQVGLSGRIHHKPNELSGGQQQRVAIARSLVNQPKIIFADEPTGNLDSKSQDEIMRIFADLNVQGMTIILVTHEEEVAQYAKRVIKMRDGLVLSDEKNSGNERRVLRTATNLAVWPAALAPAKRRGRFFFSMFEFSAHFKQAFRSLSANKVRTGLSMLGILIGVAAVIAMLALGAGAKAAIEQQLSSMGTNLLVLRSGSRRTGGVSMQSGESARITLSDAINVQKEISAVKQISRSVQGRGQLVYANKNWNTLVNGVDPQYASMRASEPLIGRFFTEEENLKRSRVAVIGQTVVRELFGDKSPIGESIKVNRVSFQVIGILPEKGANSFRDQDDLIVVPLLTAMRRLLGKDYVDSVDIQVVDAEHLEETQDQVQRLVVRSHHLPPSQTDAFEVRNMAELQEALTATSRTMTWLLGSIAAVSLLVGGIGIMNIMLVSVTERTREIGLRKAVGARRFDILAQFLIEATVVSLAGGLAGVALGVGISVLLAQFAGWATQVSLQSILFAAIFSMSVGIGFGFWPARKAAALNPIDALRYE